MQKNIAVTQDGIKECGSACLLSLIRYYGGNVSINKLLELTKTNKDGTNFYNLRLAAEEIGLTGKAYKIDNTSKLYEIGSPFISQVLINNYTHFVVIYKMNNQKLTIMDPAKGMTYLTLKEFLNIWTGYILILEPYKQLPIYKDDNPLNKVIRETLYLNKKMIINIIFQTLIITIFTCLYSYHFKIIIDNIIETNKVNLLVVSIIFTIIISVKLVIEFLRNNLVLYLNQKIDLSIITTTIERIISLPYSYYKNKTTGETISRINDLFYIKNVISKIIVTLSLDLIMLFTIIIILYSINRTMTMLLLIITLIYFFIFLIYKYPTKELTNNIQETSAKVNSLLVESINSYETIKGLNLEKSFVNKINKAYLKVINNNLELTKIVYSSEFLKDITTSIIIVFIIYIGTYNIMDKSLTIGSLITYNSLISYYINPVRNIFSFYKELYYAKNSIKRVNNLLDVKYEKLDKKTDLGLLGDIKIKNLIFSYNPQNKILNNINLDIPQKTKLLILGASGTGKSTLLKIIYKYYEIERNHIFINNYDINDFSTLDIRENITYISQNEFLYTNTIRNNIILDRDISESEFIKVCNLTHVNDIIKNNVLGYNMPLEENGRNISGGERQRIILARALLKKNNILLIDEGLNEMDIKLERIILNNIFNYYPDKTIIIISHRRENVKLFDKVIYMEEGSIKGVYAKFK